MKTTKGSTRKEVVQILNPLGTPPPITLIPMAPRLKTLDSKTIYIVDVGFQLTEPFYDAAIKLLKEKLRQEVEERRKKQSLECVISDDLGVGTHQTTPEIQR